MPASILIFGQLTDITGSSNLLVDDIVDTDGLIAFLNEKYPALKNTKYIMAVDKQVISENTLLNNSHTVALLPAFSGG
jgi:molybdopterin synthase sulfur carrier subunit